MAESEIQLCPNFCDERAIDFCALHEPSFVEALGAKVKSDRCCDIRRCQCVCHFTCGTITTKEDEFKAEGFEHCVQGNGKDAILELAAERCKVCKHL